MQIHGVELDFHLYDEDKADVKERYFEELRKMGEIKKEMPSGTEAEKNRYPAAGSRGCLTMCSVKVRGSQCVEMETICLCT